MLPKKFVDGSLASEMDGPKPFDAREPVSDTTAQNNSYGMIGDVPINSAEEAELQIAVTFWENIHFFVMLTTCWLTPLAVICHNPDYLHSSTGYADGGDMYSHIAEAIHLKELLESDTLNFWYYQVSLGYPMFTAYQPLPCFFIASAMVLFSR